MSKIKVPETTLQALFEDGRLYSMQEYIDRWPEAWTPELKQFILDFNKDAAKRAAEDERRAAEAAAEKEYHTWDHITMKDFITDAMERLNRLRYLFEFFEGNNNDKAREIDAIIVCGHNAVSHGVCGDNSRKTRERFIEFIERSDALTSELKIEYRYK